MALKATASVELALALVAVVSLAVAVAAVVRFGGGDSGVWLSQRLLVMAASATVTALFG
jgi:hypothetical protein